MVHNNQSDDRTNIDVETDSSEKVEKDLRRIAGVVANIPDVEPPDELIGSVMARIQPKKSGLWKRLWRRLQFPIYITPLKLAPLGASAVVALLLVTLVFLGRIPNGKDATSIIDRTGKMGTAVTFTLNMPDASNVNVIGSFNQWTPNGFRMHWDKSRGLWILSVRLETGRYEYAFLVDGQVVVPDPEALLQQDDGFGNKNSVLVIERGNGHETKI